MDAECIKMFPPFQARRQEPAAKEGQCGLYPRLLTLDLIFCHDEGEDQWLRASTVKSCLRADLRAHPSLDNFELTEAPIPEPGAGSALFTLL